MKKQSTKRKKIYEVHYYAENIGIIVKYVGSYKVAMATENKHRVIRTETIEDVVWERTRE